VNDASATDTTAVTFLLLEGDAFDPQKARVGLRRLTRTATSPLETRKTSAFNLMRHTHGDASIHVTEIASRKISLIGGRSNLGEYIGIAYTVFNLLGGEELISSEIDGSGQSALALTLAEESLFGSRASLSFTVFQNVLRHVSLAVGNQHF